MQLHKSGKIKLVTQAQVIDVIGNEKLTSVLVKHDVDGDMTIPADYFLPLLGLPQNLGRSLNGASSSIIKLFL